MPEKMKPASNEDAPDPSNSYERSHPEREAGMGRLDNNKSTPTNRPDSQKATVKNSQNTEGQVNGEEVQNRKAARKSRGSRKE